jgi:hypothetical protein
MLLARAADFNRAAAAKLFVGLRQKWRCGPLAILSAPILVLRAICYSHPGIPRDFGDATATGA